MKERISSSPPVTGANGVPLDLVVRVAALVEARCGLQFDEARQGALRWAIATRMQHLSLVAPEEYHERLRANHAEAEFRRLVNLVTVTETCFFRDAAQFRLLRHHILPTLLRERAAEGRCRLRLRSAGCSSGEEAYSIAITLCEMGLPFSHREWQIEVVGTDVNTEVLERAREGVYGPRALRFVPEEIRARYFQRDGPRFRVTDEVRRLVRFEFGNLTDEPLPTPGEQDVVFCKHVVIYFRPETVERLVAGLYDALAPGGYLLLGPTESLWSVPHRFTLVDEEGAFCYRKAPAPAPSLPNRRGGAPARERGVTEFPALVAAPSPLGGEYEQCRLAFREGAWSSAETRLDALVRRWPDFVPARLLLGGLYVHRGRYDEALAQAAEILQLDDLEARAYLLIGMIEARRGRPTEALAALRRALYLNDGLVLGHFWLGNLYRERGELNRACLEYGQVVRLYEQRAFDLTEEFACDLSITQLVDFCRHALATTG